MDPDPLPAHLSKILSLSPPQSTHPPSSLTGPLTSHTGLAYLFLALSAAHPRLQVHSYPATHWARAYISNIPTPSAPLVPFPPAPHGTTTPDTGAHHNPVVLGLLSDALAGPAIRACIMQDLTHVRFFLSLLAPVLAYIGSASSPLPSQPSPPPPPPPPPTCLLHGLAGTLYLLRMIRHWVPSSAPLVSRAIVQVSDYLLAPSTPWTCPSDPSSSSPSSSSSPHRAPSPSPSPLSQHVSPADRHGAAHGALGTVTQIVLTSPPLARALTPRLAALLDLQLPDGNWPGPAPLLDNGAAGDAHHNHHPTAAAAAAGGVGFASGPQGLVISLLSLRPFFPTLQARIDGAVAGAREFLWARAREAAPGTAREPGLFYGVLGTALALPKGPQRTHLLTLPAASPPESQSSPSSFPSSVAASSSSSTTTTTTTTTPGALMTSTSPGAAWAHSVREREMPRMIFYNDV